MKVVRVTAANGEKYRAGIVAIEQVATYPLGSDFFRIDHGEDYFRFFERLGALRYYAMVDSDRVIAVAAAVLRHVPFASGEAPRSTWYLCDLKVHPDFRGQRIPLQFFAPVFFGAIFGVRALRTLHEPGRRTVESSGVAAPALSLGTFSARRDAWYLFALCGGGPGMSRPPRVGARPFFLGLSSGYQRSTFAEHRAGAPFVACFVQATRRRSDATGRVHAYGFCTRGHSARASLAKRGIHPAAHASVIAHGMPKSDWSFVDTSEI